MRTTAFLLTLALSTTASAAPHQFTQSGRLFTAAGVPMTAATDITFTIYDAPATGVELWTETINVSFDNGYYTVKLGAVTELTPDLFDDDDAWLEIHPSGGAPLAGRVQLTSVPWALNAETADHADSASAVSGGSVNATEVQINGTTVIDSSGNIDFGNITNAPTDNDTLAGITSCSNGQVLTWTGSWGCGDHPDAVQLVSDSGQFLRSDQDITLNGSLDLGGSGTVTGLSTPSTDTDAATKKYVDDALAAAVASVSVAPEDLFWWANVSLGNLEYRNSEGDSETLSALPASDAFTCTGGDEQFCIFRDSAGYFNMSFIVPKSEVDHTRYAPDGPGNPDDGGLVCWPFIGGDNEPGNRNFSNAIDAWATDINGGHTSCAENGVGMPSSNDLCVGIRSVGTYTASHTQYGVFCLK